MFLTVVITVSIERVIGPRLGKKNRCWRGSDDWPGRRPLCYTSTFGPQPSSGTRGRNGARAIETQVLEK
jgi:hypothetical protein